MRLPVLLLFFVLGTMSGRAEVTILDVRTGLHPDKTRIVLEVSEKTFYTIRYLDNPKEIIIDMKETPSRNEISALVRRARVIGVLDKLTVEDANGEVRLKISLRKPATIDKSFILNPDYGKQYRLVFDLKAVSDAEWARQVKLTPPPEASQEPVTEVKPVEPAPPALPVTPVVPSLPVAEEPKKQTVPEPKSETASISEAEPDMERYDDMVTEDDNFSLSGYVEVEGRLFPQSGFNPDAIGWTTSFALEPELEYVSDSGASQFTFRPFGRVDVRDSGRSHFDIRELKWTGTFNRWQMTVGIDNIFWGVTESLHLVDILNQNDNLEDIDREDKLGQPLVSLSYDSDIGLFSVYLTTYFREMRFPGPNGRLGFPLPVDTSQTQYQAGDNKWNVDMAVRWSHVIGPFDVGVYHFRGTNRDPVFLAGTDSNGNAVLVPRYNLINQTGIDVQATFEDLLFKFEAITRNDNGSSYFAMAGGVEYSFYGVIGEDTDISLLAEYLYDDRGALATTPFEDDLFVGMRLAANDVDSSEFLLGAIADLDSSAKYLYFEGSRRIGDHWKITLDARFFLGIPATDIGYFQSRDDFFQLRLARYF